MEHTIFSEGLTVTVSELGAELRSIVGCDGTEYLWQGNGKYWSDRAPNIFPYVARLTKGKYIIDGKTYSMEPHGFACKEGFSLVGKKENELIFELSDNENTYTAYPRHFLLRITYRVKASKLTVIYSVSNLDNRVMYYGIGGHPGFNLPLKPGIDFEDYYLEFDGECSPKRVGFTRYCYLNGEKMPYELYEGKKIKLSHGIFSDDAIVLTDIRGKVTLKTDKDGRGITVSFPKMNYLGIWQRPNTDAPYICIEPWSSLPSTQDVISVFEEQEDLMRLEGGMSEEYPIEIEVK